MIIKNNRIRILIVGGNSFIAQNFIESYKNIFEICSVSRRESVFEHNSLCRDYFNLEDSLFKNINVVINFVAIVHKPNCNDEDLYRSINFELPVYLAKMALKNGCKHFIQMSTISVYGEAEVIDKNTLPKPINHYGNYKLLADQFLFGFNENNFKTTCIRPTLVYGAKDAPGNMLSLVNLLKQKIPLPFKGIQNSRQFLNIHNLTRVIREVIDRDLIGVVIVADEETISTSALVDLITETLGHKNRHFKSNLFWKLIELVKPNVVKKLTQNLCIKNTYSYDELGINNPISIQQSIRNMIF